MTTIGDYPPNPPPEVLDRRLACSVHPHMPAAAYCTECRRPYSGRFLSVLADGRAVCFRCVRDQRLSTLEPGETRTDIDPAFENGWWRAAVGAIRTPIETIGVRPYEGPVRPAFIFGLVMSLLGSVLPLVFPAIFAPEALTAIFEAAYGEGEGRPELTADQMRMAFFSALPIAALLKLGIGAALLHVGLRLAGARTGHFRESVRAFALSTGVLLFAIIPPPYGLMVISLLWGSAMMRWVQARYSLSPLLSMIAIFPALLLLVIL